MFCALRHRSHRRTPGQRGAVAVEAALITPLLIMLVFAIIEFGFLFKDWLGVTSAVRAGARIASAEPRTASYANDAAAQVAKEGAALKFDSNTLLWVYKANAAGYPSGSDYSSCPTTTCIQYKWNGSGFVVKAGTWDPTSQNACQGDSGHDSVGVYLAVKDTSLTGMFFNTMTLRSRTVMSLEPVPATDIDVNGCKP